MTMKQIRNELEALREAISAPAASSVPSAFDAIEARLDRLADRQQECAVQAAAADIGGAVSWLHANYPEVKAI